MRDIKFRAWDKKNEQWIKPEFGGVILIGEDGHIAICHNKPDGRGAYTAQQPELMTWERSEEIEILESTGLKDMNGIEIYEGDIVNRTEWEEAGEPTEEPLICEVVYGNGGKSKYIPEYPTSFCLLNKNFWHEQSLLRSNRCDLEVIGNIYENPELIK